MRASTEPQNSHSSDRPLSFIHDVAARLVERYRLQYVAPRTEPNQPRNFLEGVTVLEALTVPITSLNSTGQNETDQTPVKERS
jgi:hypothetical protein